MKIRSNQLEEKVRQIITRQVYIDHSCECDNTVRTMIEFKKFTYSRKKNTLFQDALSPYLTAKGNPKITEFVLYCPEYGIDWRIECKQQQTETNLIAVVYEELNYVDELPEDKYCLILDGVLNRPHIRKRIKDEIEKRNLEEQVWFGSPEQFEEMLKKQVRMYK